MSLIKAKGVDISSLNEGNADLSIIQKAGYSFVMIRCAQGTRIIDSYFARNVAKAEQLGMPWGVYLLTEATTTAQAQAEAALADRLIKEQMAKGYKPTLPIAIDIEEAGFSDADYNPRVLTNTASVWVAEMKKRGYYPMIYTGIYDIRDYLSAEVVNSCDIWLAEWGRYSDYQEDNLGLWQFSDGATDLVEYCPIIPGLNAPVDKNICYKDYPTIIKSGGYNGWDKDSGEPMPEPEPTPEPEPEPDSDAPALPPDAPTVAAVQTWLNDNYNAGLVVDGIYGRLTKAALVKALQTELNRQCGAGLVVDGIFGPCTKAAVFNVGVGRQGNITRILQGLLICNGFNPSGFTGYFGAGTEAAVREFQYRAGLTVDGVAGKATFAALCG